MLSLIVCMQISAPSCLLKCGGYCLILCSYTLQPLQNTAFYYLLPSSWVCHPFTNHTCEIWAEAPQSLEINCCSCRGKTPALNGSMSHGQRETQLTLNLSIYEAPWNFKLAPATGYKTRCCPWNKNIGSPTLFPFPMNNWQGHIKIVHILLMNVKLDSYEV